MHVAPHVVHTLADELAPLGWVTDLRGGGSLASGDYRPRISDLNLVAIVDGQVDNARRAQLVALHRGIDKGAGSGLKLGCLYVNRADVNVPSARHPTWTHGSLVERSLSGITPRRAGLLRLGGLRT